MLPCDVLLSPKPHITRIDHPQSFSLQTHCARNYSCRDLSNDQQSIRMRHFSLSSHVITWSKFRFKDFLLSKEYLRIFLIVCLNDGFTVALSDRKSGYNGIYLRWFLTLRSGDEVEGAEGVSLWLKRGTEVRAIRTGGGGARVNNKVKIVSRRCADSQ